MELKILKLESFFKNMTILIENLSLLQTGPSNPGTWFQVINVISLLLAMWGVISILRAVGPKLYRNRIRAKFIAVQLAMVFSEAQNTLLSLLASRNVIGCVSTRGSMVQANRKIYVQVNFNIKRKKNPKIKTTTTPNKQTNKQNPPKSKSQNRV